MSGGTINIPIRIANVFALRTGINSKNIPDELLQTVNSIKVKLNPDEWKSVPRPTPYSWRSGIKSSSPSQGSPRNSLASTGSAPSPGSQPSPSRRYVSKFNNTETSKVDDKILNTIINGKLNKFSPANYDEIKQFLEQILDSGETAFVKDFMLLVFKKAAAEEMYCPHYARLLAELTKSYASLQSEMITLQKSFMTIFQEFNETDTPDYASFLERNQQKIYRLGYSQFLAELAHREILDSDTLNNTLTTLIGQIKQFARCDDKNKLVEEYCDCILRMTKIFKKKDGAYLSSLKKIIHKSITPQITEIIQQSATDFPSVSKKAKFALMDVIDILQNA